MKAMVGWRLDVPLAHLADAPRAPAAILQASPGYDGEPPEPAIPPDFTISAHAGAWAYRDGNLLGERVGEHGGVALALGQLHRHQPRELRRPRTSSLR